MVRVGRLKSTQNSLPEKICFDLYLTTWKETSVHKNICPNSSVVERHKGVACLYEVRLAEERRNLVSTVTTISTNYLDLGCYSSCVSIYERHLQATVAQHCSLLLHPGSFLGTWCIYIVWIQHLFPFRWTMKGQVAMEKKIRKGDPADINYTYWTKQHAGFFFFSSSLRTAGFS